MEWNFYVYILRCSDGSFYTGVTNDIDRRLSEHDSGIHISCYTYKRRPLSVVLCEHYQYINDAIFREKQIKRWSRKKKQALFEDQIILLQRLAERRIEWTVAAKLCSLLHRRFKRLIGTVMVRSDASIGEHCVSNHDTETGCEVVA